MRTEEKWRSLFRRLDVELEMEQCRNIRVVSGFENGPDFNFEILICSETIGYQLSFSACFMFIAAWIHFLSALIQASLAYCETKKFSLKD